MNWDNDAQEVEKSDIKEIVYSTTSTLIQELYYKYSTASMLNLVSLLREYLLGSKASSSLAEVAGSSFTWTSSADASWEEDRIC